MSTTPPPPPPQGQPYRPVWEDPQPPTGSTAPSGQQGWGPGHPTPPPVPSTPPEPKKSWFRRHKILTALLVVVGIGVVGNALSGGEEPEAPDTAAVAPADPTEDAAPAPDTEEAAGAEEAAEPEADAEEPAEPEAAAEEPAEAEAEEPAEEPAADEPGVGDAVRDGKFEFVVTEVEPGLATVGEGFTEEEAQGQFVLIHLTVTNIGDQPQTLFDSNQVLFDEQGRQHSTSSSSIWLDEGLWLDEINPGNSMNGVLLYDIPADALPSSLELHDSAFSDGVTVTLQ